MCTILITLLMSSLENSSFREFSKIIGWFGINDNNGNTPIYPCTGVTLVTLLCPSLNNSINYY